MKRIAIIPAAALIIAAASCSGNGGEKSKTLSGLSAENFETTVDGKATKLYVLKNAKGMEACVTNFGGRIVSLMVPGADGEMRDVVLGHDSIADYVNIDGNFGALIGRYGNRINQGKIKIDDVEYQLPQNNYGHCLHGGPKGFHNAMWDAEQPNDSTLVLTLSSPDGEAGFPGNVNVKVTYTLAGSDLDIAYEATTDKPTVLNLTNHTYFNLSGNPANNVLDETLSINASGYTPIDPTFMTSGEIAVVEGTPFDFRAGKKIGKDIETDNEQLKNGLGYDHNFVLDTKGDINLAAVTLTDSISGIEMQVFTTEPGIQVYTGNFLDGTVKGKKGIVYPRRGAICLETQHYPDSPNKPEWPSVVVRPGETYKTHTIYRFSEAK